MCGICGIVGVADEALVGEMTSALAHRGPDGSGVRAFAASEDRPPMTLGHRRLSVIDPDERASQPMEHAGRYWISYNGEVYNFRELRRELEATGARFRTDCDTEVVLAMYARHGVAMLPRLNGIFALAIWDREAGELFLARDRLGVKPLYHAQRGQRLYFASEVKSLLPALGRLEMDRSVLSEYLTFLWVPEPETMFAGVSKLPAGHWARFAGGRLRIQQWWDLEFAPDERDETAWAPEVRDAVGQAVRRQMVADVPLGAFLSGGIDSSAIVAEMSRGATDPVTTYTIGSSPEDLAYDIVPDDLRYARQVGERFGTDYHERTLAPEIVELLPRLIWHLDEPIADPACIATYLICRAARERLTVILSGMGGDEIFAGYPRHLAARLARGFDVLPVGARGALRRTISDHVTLGRPGRMRGPRRNLRKLVRGLDASPSERYLRYSSYYTADELRSVLSPELSSELGASSALERHRDHLRAVSGEHWLNQLLYLDTKTFLPCLNLNYTDKMSMAASTEVRVPLLDDELVALSARIPPQLKLRRLTRKYIFKRSMTSVLPQAVIWRPKAGFGAPIRSWLLGDLRPMVEELLSERAVAERGLLQPKAVRQMIVDNDAGREDNALRIWALLTLELWQRTFVDGAVSAPAR